ncbi:MAG: lipoprotein [Burkholderiales bacterium]|nr:lipoprotein [Burkholderiales bacterium]
MLSAILLGAACGQKGPLTLPPAATSSSPAPAARSTAASAPLPASANAPTVTR